MHQLFFQEKDIFLTALLTKIQQLKETNLKGICKSIDHELSLLWRFEAMHLCLLDPKLKKRGGEQEILHESENAILNAGLAILDQSGCNVPM